jgi:hypothetical protein
MGWAWEGGTEKFLASPTVGDSTRENCCINIGFLKHGISVTFSKD